MLNQYITDFSDLPKIIAIDFDGTLCEDKFPSIGKARLGTISLLKSLQRKGWKTILWTCRNGQHLEDALNWCAERNLKFDAVNTNIAEAIELTGSDTRKVYADIYLDDHNLTDLNKLQVLLQGGLNNAC